jgi:S-DNA-T family DNA segregation ATPase FtsK/SpoIIIE
MARSSLKDSRSAPRENPEPDAPAHEFTGLLLLAAGLLVFLSLISYTPADLPDWLPFHNATARPGSHHSLNYLGIIGAILAFGCYSLLGSAAYLLCAVLLGYGSAKLILPGTRLTRRALWSIAFVSSGACLAHILDLPLIEARRLALESEGGLIGSWFGGLLLREILGSVGALVLLFVIYSISLLSMTGIHPREVLQPLVLLPPRIAETLREWLAHRAEQRALLRAQREAEAERDLVGDSPSALPSPPRNERRRNPKSPVPPEERPTTSPASIPSSPGTPEPGDSPHPASAELGPDSETPGTGPSSGDQPAPQPADPPRPAPKIIDGTAPPPRKPKEPKREGENLSILENVSCEGYQLPSIDLLDPIDESSRESVDPEELRSLQNVIIETLQQFGIEVAPGDITRGPTITRYEVYPAKGVRVDRIVALERDLARATRAERINILAPIPGKDTVGIEIANSKKQKVTLRELFESDDFSSNKAKIPIALGKDVYGKTIIADLAAMPHGLVAGTTGSGKSVCINAIIASILYRFTPEELRFIMIDPKVVEMQMYNTLPHLVVPVVTDPKKVLLALRWAVDEMEKRYAIFAKTGVRNIASFNARPKPKTQKELDAERRARQPELFDEALRPAPLRSDLPEGEADPTLPPATASEAFDPGAIPNAAPAPDPAAPPESVSPVFLEETPPPADDTDPESLTSEERIEKMTTIRVPRDTDLRIPEKMSYIVIIVDELADLMQTAPADVESAIARITQKARAAGIHMIIATQTPRADVITGVIKANVPCRVAFQVASALDSRVILDENGAERLLGQGDMLYRPPGTSRMVRAQGVLVTDEEVRRLVEFASAQGDPQFENSIQSRLQGEGDGENEEVSEEDEDLVDKCIEVMRQEKKASTSLFQRRLRLGYTRAARILDILEMRGYVGPGEGAKPREILVDLDTI